MYNIQPFFILVLFFSAAQWLQQLCEAPARVCVAVSQRKKLQLALCLQCIMTFTCAISLQQFGS